MTVQSPDLISELLRGMRLSGVKYRRIEASAPFGVAFHQAPGRAQFHFVSHGSALLRNVRTERWRRPLYSRREFPRFAL